VEGKMTETKTIRFGGLGVGKTLQYASIGAGLYHGFCDARGIPVGGGLEFTLTFVPTIVRGVYGGIVGLVTLEDIIEEIPDDFVHRTSLTPAQVLLLIPGATRKREVSVARRIIDQEWIELPAFDKADGPAQDYYQILQRAPKLA